MTTVQSEYTKRFGANQQEREARREETRALLRDRITNTQDDLIQWKNDQLADAYLERQKMPVDHRADHRAIQITKCRTDIALDMAAIAAYDDESRVDGPR